MRLRYNWPALVLLSISSLLIAQPTAAQASGATPQAIRQAEPASQLPHLIKFSGTLQDFNPETGGDVTARGANASTPSTVVGMTFSLYSQQTGGVPLWSEVQNVQVDKSGHYAVELGSTKPDGLPVELFTSAQAQWLGIRQEGQPEQTRIMLMSVPYAMKASDAETLGGKPASAFMTVRSSKTATPSTPGDAATIDSNNPAPPTLGGQGTPFHLALWTSPTNLSSSSIFQSPAGFVGIGTNNPPYTLSVFNRNPGDAIYASESFGNGVAVYGDALGNGSVGVIGNSESASGEGVIGTNLSTSGTAIGVHGTTASTGGDGVLGQASSASGINAGVYGDTNSPDGTGVIGKNTAESGAGVGMFGISFSPSSTGIVGVGIAQSSEGGRVTLRPIGVWGDTDQSSGIGMLATADFGIAIAAYNNAENISTAKFQNDETTDEVGNILATRGPHFGGICVIDVGGNLGCNGSKSAVVPVDGGARKVALYAVEAPENWFEDAGSGQLSNGAATIKLEPTFAQTVNTGLEYHVFLTPSGDCKGLYVTNKAADSFEVRELGGGTANISFDYRIMARRKGYESIRLADRTRQFDRVVNEGRDESGNAITAETPPTPGPATRAAAVQSTK